MLFLSSPEKLHDVGIHYEKFGALPALVYGSEETEGKCI
jgi:hypothetical protein